MGLFNKNKPEDTVHKDGTIVASAYNGSRALVASASRLNLKDARESDRLAKRLQKTKWQKESWDYYDLIGEIKFSANLIANVLSRINIYVAYVEDTARVPTPIDKSKAKEHAEVTEAILQLLESGDGGTSGILRDAALNYFIAGEYYLVKEPADYFRGTPEKYQVRSIDELIVEGTGKKKQIYVRSSPDDEREDWISIPETGFVSRLWRKHPRWSGEADSSMRGILDECDDLLLYSREARSVSSSRIGAGILFVPDGIDNASTPNSDDDPESDGTDDTQTTISEELTEALTGPIGNESHANSVVPIILRGPVEMGEKIRLIELAKIIDPMYSNNITFKLERILQALDIPKDIAKGMSNLKYCADEATEIYTKEGWKTYKEVSLDDELYTLNHETGEGEWQKPSKINIFPVENEPMRVMEKATHSSLTTMDHRWPVVNVSRQGNHNRKWTTSREFTSNNRIPLSAKSNTIPTEKTYDDSFVELVAWYWTEGCVPQKMLDGQRGYITICQSHTVYPDNTTRLENSLEDLYGSAYETLDRSGASLLGSSTGIEAGWRKGFTHTGRETTFFLNKEASIPLLEVVVGKDKIVSKEFINTLTEDQLNLFVHVSMLADGHHRNGDQSVHVGSLGQKNPEALESFELACTLLGIPHAFRVTQSSKHDYPWNTLHLKSREIAQPIHGNKDKNEVLYTGDVWCPTTPNQTWFARRNGTTYFTGNSNGIIIEESLFKSHIEPLILLVIDGLTNGFLRPAMAAQGIPDDVIAKTVIWYDPSAITAKPSKSEAANFGVENNLLSASSWRAENGFTEKDAPTEEDFSRKLVDGKLILDPVMSEKLLNIVLPNTMKEIRQDSLGTSAPADANALNEALSGPGGTPVEEGVVVDGPLAPVTEAAPTGLIEP